MKTKTIRAFKFGVIAIGVLGLSTLVSCDKDNDNTPADNRPYTISGNASGSQMVPSNGTSGTGTITGTYDPATRQFTYTSTWSGLTGAPTMASFYSGATGMNGVQMGSNWSLGTTPTGSGTVSSSMTLTDVQAASLTSGGWYYTYGTAANPSGEIRGQITANR